MRTGQRVEYMAFPRIAALAEVAWSPATGINWADFQRRLDPQLRRYDKQGIRWARDVQLKPLPRKRLSHDLEQCGDGYLLSLEDDAPVDSVRAVFLVNISNPCWIWRGAELGDVKALHVTVGQIPFNFQIGADAQKIPLPRPASHDGELEVRLHPPGLEPVVHHRDALRRAGRAVHRQPGGQGAGGPVAPGDVEPAQVDAVVWVQVGEDDRVEVVGWEVALQRTERPAAEVEQQVPGAALHRVLQQVTGRG